MCREVLYEDDEIKVIFRPGVSDYLLITFGDLISLASGDRFYADVPVTKLGMNCVGFMAKKPNWFPCANMEAAIRCIDNVVSRFSCRVAYGGSMGGYAAIKYSALLGVSEVIAFCPQWSIDPAECAGKRSGYEKFFNPSMAAMGIRKSDVAGRICVLYDPAHEIDSFHYSHIAALCDDLVSMRVRMAGHHVTSILAGTLNMSEIIEAFRDGDVAKLNCVVSDIRRKSKTRARILLQAAVNKHPILVHNIVYNSNIGYESMREFSYRLFSDLISLNKINEAREVIRRSGLSGCECRAGLLREMMVDCERRVLIKTSGVFMACHKTILVYSAFHGRLFHKDTATIKADRMNWYPVFLAKKFGFEVLALWISGRFLACHVDSHGQVGLKELPCEESEGLVVKGDDIGNGVTFLLNDSYISAELNGNIAYNRHKALEWEIFRRNKNNDVIFDLL